MDAAQIDAPLLTLLFTAARFRDPRPETQSKVDWLWAWARRQNQQPQILFNTYVALLGKARRWERARETLEEMKVAGPQPDVVTYTSLVAAYGKDRQSGRAREMLEEMKAAGVEPNAITFSSLISGYTRGGEWDRARETLEEMKAAGLKPDNYAYSSLISAYGNSGRWEQSRAAFEELKSAGLEEPNGVTYTALVQAYVTSGQWDSARAALEEMKAAGLEPHGLRALEKKVREQLEQPQLPAAPGRDRPRRAPTESANAAWKKAGVMVRSGGNGGRGGPRRSPKTGGPRKTAGADGQKEERIKHVSGGEGGSGDDQPVGWWAWAKRQVGL